MKDLIGIKVKVFVDGVKVEGVVVADRPDRVFIQSEEGKPAVRIPKGRISFFIPDKEPEEFTPVLLLYCQNKDKKCPGVFYTQKGAVLTRKSFEVFMGPCPRRTEDCHCGSLGDLRTIPSKTLAVAVGGMLLGDYPKKENGTDGN
jgi:hypothetical protein